MVPFLEFQTAHLSSEIVNNCSGYNNYILQAQSDWHGHYLYQLIHPDDITKVREQLSIADSQSTGNYALTYGF